MKINKKSWHYWLNEQTASQVYKDLVRGYSVGLCDYFWGTVKSVIQALAVVLGCILFGSACLLLVGVVLHAIIFLVTGAIGYPLSWVSLDWAMSAIILTSLLTLVCGFAAWLQDEIEFAPNYMKIKSSPVKYEKPSLVGSYYSAWKDKVCPLVELEGVTMKDSSGFIVGTILILVAVLVVAMGVNGG